MNEMLQEVLEKMDRESPFFEIYYAKENKRNPLVLINEFIKEEKEEKALKYLELFLPNRLDLVEQGNARALMSLAIQIIIANSKLLCVENLAYVFELENFVKESKNLIEETKKADALGQNGYFMLAGKLKDYLEYNGYASDKDNGGPSDFAQTRHNLAILHWRELFSMLKTKNGTWI